MGRYTFFDDFLKTDIMNHVEVLKEMMKLGVEDDRLLVPVLINLAKQNQILPKQPILPFYHNHQNLKKTSYEWLRFIGLCRTFADIVLMFSSVAF